MISDQYLEERIILDNIINHDIGFFTYVPNYSSRVNRSVSRTPLSSKFILGGCRWILPRYFEERIIHEVIID